MQNLKNSSSNWVIHGGEQYWFFYVSKDSLIMSFEVGLLNKSSLLAAA